METKEGCRLIRVSYLGTLGNQLWQYSAARVLAQHLGRPLVAPPIQGFPRTTELIGGNNNGPLPLVQRASGQRLPSRFWGREIQLEGHFERVDYLNRGEGLEQVKAWARTPEPVRTKPHPDSLVVSIRRGWNGYPTEMCPPVDFYHRLISELGNGVTWITTDSPEDPWFQPLIRSNLNIQFFKGSAVSQYAFVSSAARVVMAPSTFTWWAAFVGVANKIYWPSIPALKNKSDGRDWIPKNDDRYEFLE